jgi:hypothetical protein
LHRDHDQVVVVGIPGDAGSINCDGPRLGLGYISTTVLTFVPAAVADISPVLPVSPVRRILPAVVAPVAVVRTAENAQQGDTDNRHEQICPVHGISPFFQHGTKGSTKDQVSNFK